MDLLWGSAGKVFKLEGRQQAVGRCRQAMNTLRFISLLLLLVASSFKMEKRFYGRYKDPKSSWGDDFIFKKDLTFYYKCRLRTVDNVDLTDSSSGDYKILDDTLVLTYATNLYHPLLSDSPNDSIDLKKTEPHGYFGNRPQRLYWQGKKIYYIREPSGEIFRNKQHHLTYVD
jgi:hypothetical protein